MEGEGDVMLQFILGTFVGVILGMFVMSILTISSRGARREEKWLKDQKEKE